MTGDTRVFAKADRDLVGVGRRILFEQPLVRCDCGAVFRPKRAKSPRSCHACLSSRAKLVRQARLAREEEWKGIVLAHEDAAAFEKIEKAARTDETAPTCPVCGLSCSFVRNARARFEHDRPPRWYRELEAGTAAERERRSAMGVVSFTPAEIAESVREADQAEVDAEAVIERFKQENGA